MIFDDLSARVRPRAIRRPHQPTRESFSVWTENAASADVGGDWCAIVPLSENVVALTVGDVAGPGPDAAAVRDVIYATVLSALTQTHVPSHVLFAANDRAFGDGSPVIVTAIVAVYDRIRRTVTLANAGHPPPLVVTGEDHEFVVHPPADLPLGIFPRHEATNHVIALPHDALLVMYTDGVTEHDRDPVRGEIELVEAVRWTFTRPELDAARAIAGHVLQRSRGDDDAAVMALRLSRGFHEVG